MNTWFIPYSFVVFMLVLQTFFNTLFWRSFDENVTRLSLIYAVNSSSDLATEYLLEYSQETPYGNVYIDPNTVWYIYKHTMLKSVNQFSQRNMEQVEFFFPAVMIVVNDGYYIRLMTQEPTPKFAPDGSALASQPEWKYHFTQKIPFARVTTVPTPTTGYIPDYNMNNPTIPTGSIIADTLSGQNIMRYDPIKGYVRYEIDGNQLKSIAGSAHHVPSINLELLKALDYQMAWNAPRNSVYKKGGVVQIPTEITASMTSDNVTFVGPEVFVVADQFNWVGNHAMSFFTVSNTQIVENILYYCYTVDWGRGDGVQKYYSTKRPLDASGNAIPLEQVYTRDYQAAEAGYKPDPINYD